MEGRLEALKANILAENNRVRKKGSFGKIFSEKSIF